MAFLGNSFLSRKEKKVIEKYGAFTIQPSHNGCEALAVREINGEVIEIELRKAKHVLFEGWYGAPPSEIRCAISGACLYGRDWFVEFEKIESSNPACRKSPALETERIKILERLEKGKRITKMGLPRGPSAYHCQLIRWEGSVANTLGIREVFYHVPTEEYHYFIAEIERACGIGLPQAHELLDAFSQEIRRFVLEEFGDVAVHFIEPFPMASGNPNRSFLLPYRHPELFNILIEGLIGIENSVEIRLSYEAHRDGGPSIPVLGSIIALPNPYFEKGDGRNIIVLGLEE